MRTLTTPAPVPASVRGRRALTRTAALGVACSAALALAACGGSGSSHKDSSTGTAPGSTAGAQSTAAPSTQPSFDPAAGPTMTPAQLPKNCDGLVTDADMQLALGNPLNGGDFFQAYKPTAAKQLGRVVCQYGVVQDSTGKVTGDQVEIQLAIYADAATAKSRGAATVGTLAGQGDQYEQISVAGHPATYATENGKDVILVMYDGNRTFLITTQAALVTGEDAKAFTLKIAAALYKHTSSGLAAPSTSAPPASGPATPKPPASSPAGSQASPPAGKSSGPAPKPSAPAKKPSGPSSPPAD